MLYAVLGLLFGLYLGINSMIGLRGRADIAAWKPLVWEFSSVIVIFALIPFVARFERRFRLDARPRWQIALAHTGAALVFSAVHVAGMLALRKLAYALVGEQYDFDSVPIQAFYELQKDLITYAVILVVIFATREFRIRRTADLRAAELVGRTRPGAPEASDGANRAALSVQRPQCDFESHARRCRGGGSHDQRSRQPDARGL